MFKNKEKQRRYISFYGHKIHNSWYYHKSLWDNIQNFIDIKFLTLSIKLNTMILVEI